MLYRLKTLLIYMSEYKVIMSSFLSFVICTLIKYFARLKSFILNIFINFFKGFNLSNIFANNKYIININNNQNSCFFVNIDTLVINIYFKP
jgi:hypothetical protein